MKSINIKFIPHNEQRYDTCGNYGETKDEVWFEISKMSDWRYEMLITVHELIEYAIITHQKIPIEKIDAFDIKFEEERLKGKHTPTQEPGNSKKAPYFVAHKFATKCEKALAFLLNVSWIDYNKAIDSLEY